MKIGIITEYFPKTLEFDIRGGAEACAFNEAHQLSKKHEIIVLTSRQSHGDYHIDDMEVIGCGPPRPYVQKGSLLKRLLFMKDAYKKGIKYDLDVVIGYNFITHPIAWKIGEKTSTVSVARYHDVWIGEWIKNMGITGILGEILERYNLSRNFDHIIAVSEYTRDKLAKYFPQEKISVVHNMVDFKVPEHKKSLDPTITCVARLVEYKRIEDLIKATSLLIEEFPHLRCEIIGTGPLENRLKKLARKLGLEEHVRFHGFIEKHEDVLKVVASSHIFCLPSTVEGFGIVLVEAMKCGTPFVASRIPPLLEASAGRGGLFFEPKNWKDLAEKIRTLLEDRRLYNKLRGEGFKQSEKYRREYIGDKLEEILEDLTLWR